MISHLRASRYICGFVATIFLHGICNGQSNEIVSSQLAGLDLEMVSLSEASTQLPTFPPHTIAYNPLQPTSSNHFVLFIVNRTDVTRSIETSSISIRAIGGSSHDLVLYENLFGDSKHIEVEAGESKILFRKPWKELLDAKTIKLNQQQAREKRKAVGEPNRSLRWSWKAASIPPASPIYKGRDELADAATLWAELEQASDTIRSQPFLVLIEKG